MHTRDKTRSRAVRLVVLQQQFPSLLIERRFRVWVYKEALDRDENVRDAVRRLPVFLERVHANLACGGHVGMEDLRGEPACVRGVSGLEETRS